MRPLRLALLSLAVLAALVLAAIATFDSAAVQRRLRVFVQHRIEVATGARAQIGSLHLGFRPPTLDLYNVVLRGHEASTDAPLAVIPHVWLRFRPVSLLLGTVTFEQVSLDRPRLSIARLGNGELNLPPLAAGGPALPRLSLSVRQFSLQHGEMVLAGHDLPLNFAVHDVEFFARRDGSAYVGQVRLDGDPGAVAGRHPGPVHAELAFRITAEALTISRASLVAAGATLTLSGEARSLDAPRFGGQYSLRAPLAASARAAGIDAFSGGQLLSQGDLQWSASGWRAHGDFTLAHMTLAAMPPPWADWTGQGIVTATNTGISIESSRLIGSGAVVSLRGRWDFIGAATADADVGGLGLASLRPLWLYLRLDPRAAVTLALLDGRIAGHLALTSRLSPATTQAALDLTLTPVSATGIPVSGSAAFDVDGAANWHIAHLDLQAGASALHASGSLPDGIDLVASSTELPSLRPLVQPWLAATPATAVPASVLPAGTVWPGWDALAGAGTLHGRLTGSGDSLRLAATIATTHFRFGALNWDDGSAEGVWRRNGLDLTRLSLQADGQTLTASGAVALTGFLPDAASALHLQLEAADLDVSRWLAHAGMHYPVSGRVTLQATVGGTMAQPSGAGRLAADTLQWGPQAVRSLAAGFTANSAAVDLTGLTLVLGKTRIAGGLRLDLSQRRFDLNLASPAVDLAEVAVLQSSRLPVTGELRVQMQGEGSFDDPEVTVRLSGSGIRGAGESLGDVQATLHLLHGSAVFNASDRTAAGSLVATGTVAAAAPFALDAHLDLADYDFDAWLRRFTPADITGHSQASGTIEITGPLGQPQHLRASAVLDPVEFSVSGLTVHNQGAIRCSADPAGVRIEAAHFLAPQTNFELTGRINLAAGAPELALQAAGTINLALLTSLHPTTHATGVVNLDARLGGTLLLPQLTGTLNLRDASLAEQGVPLQFDSITGSVRFTGDRAQIESLTARTGSGSVALTGFLARDRAGWLYQLNAAGTAMRVRYLGISATSDLNLRLTGQPNGALLTGEVSLTRIALDDDFDLAAFIANSRLYGSPTSADSLLARTRLDVHLFTGQQLELATTTARMQLLADLRLRGTAANPSVLGRASASQGSVLFAGYQYRVDKGDVQFTNPFRIEPLLDLELSTTVPPYDVTLNIGGAVDALDITYRSDPPLSSSDIINLLATGAPTQATAALNTQTSGAFVSQSEQLLGRALDNAVAGRLQRLFGITQVQVNPNSVINGVASPGNSVTVQQQVSRDVKLTYTQNLANSAQDIVQIEWTLTKTLGITLHRDQYGLYGLQFIFHHRAR